MHRLRIGAACALLLFAAGRAAADDGVIELNQARALAGGVTPGDAPGFPVTLAESGSYRLTSNLTNPADVSWIELTANGVSLDLGGFALLGPTTCTGVLPPTYVTCASFGSAFGILGTTAGNRIRNGTIDGTRGGGLLLGPGAVVEDLVVTNVIHAIRVGFGSRVARCSVALVGGIGVQVEWGQVSDCVIRHVAGSGINDSSGSPPSTARGVSLFFMPVYMINTTSLENNTCGGAPC